MATAKKTAAPAAPAKKAAPAAKKAAAPSTAVAVAKKAGGAVADPKDMQAIKDRLRQQAESMAERTQAPGGIKIQVTQDKHFKLPDGQTVDELVACIADFRTVHNYYSGPYNPQNIVPPACFAVGTNPKAMIPIKESPELQAESCQVCPQNQFGSSPQGEGKACKNGRRLALLPPNEDGSDVDAEADIWVLDVSPTALRSFDGYVQSLARQYTLPPVAFLTTISFDPSKTYPSLMFSNPVPIDGFAAAADRQQEAAELLEVLPDWSGYEADTAKPAARKPVAKRPGVPAGKTAPVKGGMGGRARARA